MATSAALVEFTHHVTVFPPHLCSLNLDGLLERIWDMMALVRVYTKRIGAKPDFDAPVVLTKDRGGTTVEALCNQVSFG